MNAAELQQAARERNVLIVALDGVPTEVQNRRSPRGRAGIELEASALGIGRRRPAVEQRDGRRLSSSGSNERGFTHRAGSATQIRCWRSQTRCRCSPADKIVIAAEPHSGQLVESLAARARERFDLPTSHTAQRIPQAA